jgi:hypothetical protein
MLTTSMFVSPKFLRMSQTGIWPPIAAPTCSTGRSFTGVMPYGMTACEWLWITEPTSARAS